MKLREKIFLVEFLFFMFFAFGIAGNIDLAVETPTRCYIELFISMFLTLIQMFYINFKNRKEETIMLEKQLDLLNKCNMRRLEQQFENEDLAKEILLFAKDKSESEISETKD